MSRENMSLFAEAEHAASEPDGGGVRVLAVGDPPEWENHGKALRHGGVAFVSFDEVSDSVLDFYRPSVIFSPVLARAFDCIELALLLNNLGFTGSYRAMARDLPRPDVIEREVTQICPRLDFQILLVT